ncbi:MAG: ABC transporter permease [Thiovulaceae bacterium]|nr:ABC transporter permease [Sulfurimonadaceae bacterium]MCW9026618.1 ABC transporter permease [Sulfurimonadaceae bacterium]
MDMINAIFKKELLTLKRDPRLIGFLLFMPILLLLLFGYALKIEPSNVKMAYFDEDKTFFTELIKTSVWQEGYFDLYEVNSQQEIIEEIRSGNAKAGLYISKNFSSELMENNQPTVEFYVDGTMPSLTTAMKNKSNSVTDESVTSSMYFLDENASNIIIADDPFILETTTLFNPDANETWFFIPGVIGVLIMQITLLLAGISVVREKENQTMEQLLVSPISKIEFILGKILPYILIALFEFYFILSLGCIIFDIPFPPNAYIGIVILSFVYVSAMISLGLFISIVSQTQQQAMFLAIFIIIPSILLSGFMFPIEAMPTFIQPVAYFIPFTYFTEIIRSLLIKQTMMSDLIFEYVMLILYSGVFIILSIFKFKKQLA